MHRQLFVAKAGHYSNLTVHNYSTKVAIRFEVKTHTERGINSNTLVGTPTLLPRNDIALNVCLVLTQLALKTMGTVYSMSRTTGT